MPERARRNTLLKHRLAAYSQKVLQRTLCDEPIEYDRDQGGILYYHRSQRALDAGIARMKLLEADGQRIEGARQEGRERARPLPRRRRKRNCRRHLLPDRRNRRSRQIHARARRADRRARRQGPDRGHDRRHRNVGRLDFADCDRQGSPHRGRLCAGARFGERAARAQDRRPPADLSDQGLFPDDPRRQSAKSAEGRFARRGQAGCDLALRRPRARHRDRGVCGLRHQP